MFAYCNNNPVNFADNEGNSAYNILNPNPMDRHDTIDGAGCGGGIILPTDFIETAGEYIVAGVVFAVSYANRIYTRAVKAGKNLPPINQPITHHIVPYGEFSTRSKEVHDKLKQAQNIMKRAGIIPECDPINQMPLSVGYHLSLHDDLYILKVTTPIIALGPEPTQDQIYTVLLFLRYDLASSDPYALDY